MSDARSPINRRSFLLAAGAAGIGGVRPASAQASRSVVLVEPTDPRSLDPIFRDDEISGTVHRHIFDTPLHRFPDMSIRPWAAELVERQSPTTWLVRLRDNMHFTNGEPVDAEALRFSLERIVNPDSKSPIRSLISPLGTIEIQDRRTVLFHTANPDPLFTARLIWLQMVPPKYAAEAGAQFGARPIGSGPYILKRWQRNSEIVFAANPDHWRGRPAYTDVTFKIIPEEIARVSALRSGDVDVILSLSTNQAAAVSQLPGFKVLPQPTSRVAVLNFNPGAPPADNTKFRRAVALAVNRDELLKGLAKNLGLPVRTIFAASVGNLPADVATDFQYDPDGARKLVEELGLKGTVVQVGGPSGRFPLDREIVSAVAAQLRRVGLDAKARTTEFGTYVSDITSGRAASIFLQVQGNAWFDPMPQIEAFYRTGGLGSPWMDPGIDALLDRTYKVPENERTAAIGDILKRLRDDTLSVPLFGYAELDAMTDKVVWQPRVDQLMLAFEMS